MPVDLELVRDTSERISVGDLRRVEDEVLADFRGAFEARVRPRAPRAELGMRPLVAHCYLGLGMLSRRNGRPREGPRALTTASTMYREMGMTFWLEKADAELGGVER